MPWPVVGRVLSVCPGQRGDASADYGRELNVAPTRLYKWVFHRLLVLQTAACAAWYSCEQALELANSFPWQV